MRKLSLLACFALLPAFPVLAQGAITYTAGDCALFHRTDIGATSRGLLAGAAGELLARFDYEEYRGWGDPQLTGGALINGFVTWVQDQDGTTPESFHVHIYGEDPLNPDFPTIPAGSPPGTTALGSFGPYAGPTSAAASPVASMYRVNFATPLLIPNDVGDIFWSCEVPVAPGLGWTLDGISVWIALGMQPGTTFLTFDIPGAAPIAQTTYGAIHDVVNATISYGGRRQMAVDFRTPGNTAGCATAITNQGSYTISNTAPGTGNFLSGLHPDAASPPANNGRVDDIGYVFFAPNLPVGQSLALYVVDFNFGTPTLPMSLFVQGSTGLACLTPGMQIVQIAPVTGIQTSFTIAIPAVARPSLGGHAYAFSVLGLNLTNFTIQAGPCAKQAF